MICNGLALVEFAETWPTLRTTRPSERRLATLEAPKLGELRELVREPGRGPGAQGRRLQPVAPHAGARRTGRSPTCCGRPALRAVFFTGQESQRRRTQNLVDFHDDPATRVLFATDAGGVGLNLQRAASAAILLELPWNPAVLEQRVGRIHRLGQTEPVQVWAIVARGGIEERLAKLVGDKQALFRGVFDGASDEVLFDHSGSFLQGLQREVAQHRSLDPDDQEGDPDLREGELDQPAELEAQDLPVVPAAEVAPGSPSLPGLRVERAPDGTVRIEAPAEQADLLIGLLEGLLGALRAGQGTTPAP